MNTNINTQAPKKSWAAVAVEPYKDSSDTLSSSDASFVTAPSSRSLDFNVSVSVGRPKNKKTNVKSSEKRCSDTGSSNVDAVGQPTLRTVHNADHVPKTATMNTPVSNTVFTNVPFPSTISSSNSVAATGHGTSSTTANRPNGMASGYRTPPHIRASRLKPGTTSASLPTPATASGLGASVPSSHRLSFSTQGTTARPLPSRSSMGSTATTSAIASKPSMGSGFMAKTNFVANDSTSSSRDSKSKTSKSSKWDQPSEFERAHSKRRQLCKEIFRKGPMGTPQLLQYAFRAKHDFEDQESAELEAEKKEREKEKENKENLIDLGAEDEALWETWKGAENANQDSGDDAQRNKERIAGDSLLD